MSRLREVGLQLLLSLSLSLALWTFVNLTTNPDDTTSFNNIGVEVRGLPLDMVIVDENGLPRASQGEFSTVNVEVGADRATLADLSQTDIEAFVDLSNRNPGTHTVDIQVQPNRESLRNIRILEQNPATAALRVEAVITKTVPITVELTGTLPPTYEREEPQVSSGNQAIDTVVVRGPASQVERVALAATSIHMSDVRASFSVPQSLEPLDANGDLVEGVDLTPQTVNVAMEVQSSVGIKRVPIVGNVVGSPQLGYIVRGIRSDPSLVTLVGNSRRLDQVEQINTEPIDINDATSTVTREVNLVLNGVQLQSGEPETAIISVEIATVDQPFQVQVPVPVQVINADEQLLTTVTPPVIELSLEGSTNAFVQLQIDSLIATVDASNLSPGIYTLTPQVLVSQGVRIVSEIPDVTVRLTRIPQPPTAAPTPLPTQPTATTPITPTVVPATPTLEAPPEATSTPITPTVVPATPTLEAPPEAPPPEGIATVQPDATVTIEPQP